MPNTFNWLVNSVVIGLDSKALTESRRVSVGIFSVDGTDQAKERKGPPVDVSFDNIVVADDIEGGTPGVLSLKLYLVDPVGNEDIWGNLATNGDGEHP